MALPKELTDEELRKRWVVSPYYSTEAGFWWGIRDRETNVLNHFTGDDKRLRRIVDRANRRFS